MFSGSLRRFEKSMDIGYEQWHDGIGYDLDALDHLNDSEKRQVEGKLIPRAANDWRDLEALDRLGTPAAIEAILRVRSATDPQIQLYAHQYGPLPSEQEWERAILRLLETAEIYSGLTQVLNCAIEHPSEAVVAMLWHKVRSPESGVAYHCAAALCCIAGVLESIYDDSQRELFLNLVGPASENRSKAVMDLEALLGLKGNQGGS
ncbi:MAG: hypothetical protein ABL949_01255 [Fimbriimonadaceae bacterium]